MTNSNLIQEDQISIGRVGFVEPTYTNGKVTAITEWKTASKLKKVKETVLTYANGLVTLAVLTTYLDSGAVIDTLTLTPSYTGGIIDNITKT